MAVERIHQIAKNGTFCEELLSENYFEAVLINFCCYGYGTNSSEEVQKISARTLDFVRQLTKTANFISSLLGTAGDTSQIKMSKKQTYLINYLLHI